LLPSVLCPSIMEFVPIRTLSPILVFSLTTTPCPVLKLSPISVSSYITELERINAFIPMIGDLECLLYFCPMITFSWISALSKEVVGFESLKKVFSRFSFLVFKKFLKDVIIFSIINILFFNTIFNYTNTYLYKRIENNKQFIIE